MPSGRIRALLGSVAGVKKVVVLDYGSGNLRSAERALARVGADVDGDRRPRRRRSTPTASSSPASAPSPPAWPGCAPSTGPGSSAAGWPAAARCSASAWACRSSSTAASSTARTPRAAASGPASSSSSRRRSLPHMGWNTVDAPAGSVLFDGLADQRFYFVHSYGVRDFPLAEDGTARPAGRAAGHLGRARRPVRRRRRERRAVGDPVPPREERRRRRAAAHQLARHTRLTALAAEACVASAPRVTPSCPGVPRRSRVHDVLARARPPARPPAPRPARPRPAARPDGAGQRAGPAAARAGGRPTPRRRSSAPRGPSPHVEGIAAETHVAGSEASDRVVDGLVETLTDLGLDTRVQNAVGT